MQRAARVWQQGAFWAGAILGVGAATAALELPYVDWFGAAPPVDARPLTIRQDAKGNGRFLAPRSGGRQHRGIDLVGELHSSVRAIRSGRVMQVGLHRGFGRYIELEHRRGMHSLYAHLDEVLVNVGDRVRQGQRIGTVGKTGNARSPTVTPHVHLEVWRDGEPIDPQTLGLRVVEPPGLADQGREAAHDREPANARGGG